MLRSCRWFSVEVGLCHRQLSTSGISLATGSAWNLAVTTSIEPRQSIVYLVSFPVLFPVWPVHVLHDVDCTMPLLTSDLFSVFLFYNSYH